MRAVLIALIVLLGIAGCKSDSGGGIANPPPAPSSVTVTPGDRFVTIDWSGVSSAGQYNLYISTDASFSDGTTTVISNVTPPYIHNSLTNGATYYYAVSAVGEGGESGLSTMTQAKPVAPPSKPSALTVSATTNDVTLQWDDVPGAENYTLYMAAEPRISKENIKTLSSWAIIDNVTSPYTHRGLLPGVTYYFALMASNTSGSSLLSNEVAGILIPQAPAVGSITPLDSRATIEWPAVTGAQTYTFYMASESGVTPANTSSLQDARVMNNVTSPLAIDNVVNGKSYYFIITAVNSSGESGASMENSFTPQNSTPIAAGMDHSCAIREDYSLWCWGSNSDGQLGLGSYGDAFSKTVATRVGGGNLWNYINAGNYHTCGLQQDGSLWCWGANFYGALGNGASGSFERELNPVQVGDAEKWRLVAAGGNCFVGVMVMTVRWAMVNGATSSTCRYRY
jgi:fibronectin type 3 domain-containing protein